MSSSVLAGNTFHPGYLEVLLTGESSGQLWNLAAWDPQSGSTLTTYKGASSAPRTFTALADTMLVSAQANKPLLNVWMANRHEQQPQKITTPGPLNALTAIPSGQFLIGGAGDKIYVWQTSTGRIHRVLASHYQAITCLATTSDGSHFVSAGRDGNVLVWSLLTVVSSRRLPGQPRDQGSAPLPRHAWSDHKLAVTDLHVTVHGIRARVFTASLDRTAKVYCLLSGHLLLDVSFATPLSSVTVDAGEVNVFLGSTVGDIHTYSLLDPPRDLKVTEEVRKDTTFKGHTGAVTQLSVSLDGVSLASGSDDESVRIWDIQSRQTVKVIGHKGKLTLTRFVAPIKGMLEPDLFRPNLILSTLQKTSLESDKVEFFTRERFEPLKIEAKGAPRSSNDLSDHVANGSDGAQGEASTDDVEKLKRINQELYQFALKQLVN
ncbi:hypothetical protein TCAL_00730 [Tigriopus californicus]|uniref:Uncharacterized protein n=1 Tax=Tigriopus californicus TaxID=6832 RepID=A0A553PAQ0_TIGCA|nr:WD repeat-containing protein 18-like [Tigriopus californicus]TRY74762.1 hypothetical protein TCAL_00730 [Tigriopus californicus]|eukprot:TCALIF_00730-PA protein Name:"Similar to Wdr18 WD repeat-containing protein 18 (Mus musculus)" AED:0.02 eAED:0.02 QI:0/-1/0/1/-1/1/1/0/432